MMHCLSLYSVNISIEKALDLCAIHSKAVDDEVDKDIILLDEQTKLLKNLRYEKDYWKELELKTIIGDEILNERDFEKDVDEHMTLTQEKVAVLMKTIRNMVDKQEYNNVVRTLDEYSQIEE